MLTEKDIKYLKHIKELAQGFSKAKNRSIGAMLVRYENISNRIEDTIISIGWNGPPRGVDEVDNLKHYDCQKRYHIYKRYFTLIIYDIEENYKKIDNVKRYHCWEYIKQAAMLNIGITSNLHPYNFFINPNVIKSISDILEIQDLETIDPVKNAINKIGIQDPRYYLGYVSGMGVQYIIDAHAERNAIYNAARIGISTIGSTMYASCSTPCKECAIAIVQAGVSRIILGGDPIEGDNTEYNTEMSRMIFGMSGVEYEYYKEV